MLNWIRNERHILFASLAIGIFLAVGVAASTFVYSTTIQREISENVIRFHVVAHNDTQEEQDLKNYVRDEILKEFAGTLSETSDIKQTRAVFQRMMPKLQAHAQSVVDEAGYNHKVTAQLGDVFFPTSHYGKVSLPSGYYEAVQIIIGDGNGENWWCLMFPPLCYVDMTTTDISKKILDDNISDETFRLITHQESNAPDLVVRFRVVEWWQNIR